MPIFKCSRCGCAENTAVSHYAVREKGAPALCSECDPSIGKWHGRFAKMPASDFVEKNGYLISKEEDAFDKGLEKAIGDISRFKATDVSGIARFFFTAGWRGGVEFGRKG